MSTTREYCLKHTLEFPVGGVCPRCDGERAAAFDLSNVKFRAHVNLTPAGKEASRPLQVQEGGSHYKALAIQPVEYIHANGIPFIEGSVIKYVTRWREKGGLEDLRKARHFLDILLDLETRATETAATER